MVRYLIQAILILALALTIFAARHILLAAFLGVVAANLLFRLSAWTVGTSSRWRPVVAGAYLLLIIAVVGLVFWAGSTSIARQADQLSQGLAETMGDIETWLQGRSWGRQLLSPEGNGAMGRDLLGVVTDWLGSLFATVGAVAVFLMITVFGSMAPARYCRGALWLVPARLERRAEQEMHRASVVLVWWTLGRAASMLVVGLLTWIGLLILGTPAPLVLACLAGGLSFIPNLGPILSVIPAAMVALTVGPWHVAWVLALYVGVQLVESNLITPLIQQEAVTVPPALLIVFQLVMGVVAGVWGMIVATPLLVLIMLLTQSVYVRDYLGKDIKLVSESHGHSA